jgi:tRNA pseudouridine55 synthase
MEHSSQSLHWRDPLSRGDISGVLAVDKPEGLTSHDVVNCIRRKLKIKRVGHGGTLDPICTGLLIILIGRATKLAHVFTTSDKVYEGTMRLGQKTDSHDAEGKVICEGDWRSITREQLENVLQQFRGDVLQVPPMLSAVKVDGIPLYKRARRGEIVERPPKLVHIYELEVIRFAPPDVDFRVRCTKGTYVRTLCSDIGEKLGCYAYMAKLRRIASGNINVKDAIPLSEIMDMEREKLLEKLIPLSQFKERFMH